MRALINELGSQIGDKFERLTDIDIDLTHIGLNPTEARYHPALFRRSQEELESKVDAIYTAANAGNQYAEFLIHLTAMHQVNVAGHEAQAVDKDFGTVEEAIEEAWFNHRLQEQESASLEKIQAFAELSCLIAKIEFDLDLVELREDTDPQLHTASD